MSRSFRVSGLFSDERTEKSTKKSFVTQFCMSSDDQLVDYLSIPMGKLDHPGLEFLWIGSKRDANDLEKLRSNQIFFIVNCTRDHLEGGVKNFHQKEPGFRYFRVPLKDQDTEVRVPESLAKQVSLGFKLMHSSRCMEVHQPSQRDGS